MDQVQKSEILGFQNRFLSTTYKTLIPANILIGIIVLTCAFRFFNLHFQSPWLDEISTLFDTDPNLSFSQLIDNIIHSQVHPPLYFIVTHYFMQVFGFSIESVRFISAFFGTVSIYAYYYLGKEIFNKQVGLFSALLLSINTGYFGYSQEGRSYTFIILLFILSTIVFIRSVKIFSFVNLTFLTLLNVLIAYTSYFGTIFLLSQAIYLMYFLFNKEYKKFIYFSLSFIIVFVCFLPWLPNISQGFQFEDSWIKPPTLELLRPAMNSMFPSLVLKMLVVVFFIIGLYVGLKLWIKETSILFLSFVFLIVFSFIFSYIFTPILSWKYFIFALPGLLMIVALGLSVLGIKYLNEFLLVIFVFISLKLTFKDFSGNYIVTKAEFRSQVELVDQADLRIPVVMRETKVLNEYALMQNKDIEIIATDDISKGEVDLHKRLQNGWWELKLHRPYILDKIYNDSAFTRNFIFYDYGNFSAFRLALPKNRTLTPSEVWKIKDTTFYKFTHLGAHKIRMMVTDSSSFPHYSRNMFAFQSSVDRKFIRFAYKRSCGIHTLRTDSIGETIKIYPIIPLKQERKKGGIERIIFLKP